MYRENLISDSTHRTIYKGHLKKDISVHALCTRIISHEILLTTTTHCAHRKSQLRYLSLLIVYRGLLTVYCNTSPKIHEFTYCTQRKSHPRYLSFPGFIAMTLDGSSIRKLYRANVPVKKIMQSGCTPR